MALMTVDPREVREPADDETRRFFRGLVAALVIAIPADGLIGAAVWYFFLR